MQILGIHSYMHDASASIIKDSKILAAVEEERFTGKKHCDSFPKNAIKYCLKEAGTNLSQVDLVAVSWVPWKGLFNNCLEITKGLLDNKSLYFARLRRGSGYVSQMKKLVLIKRDFEKHFNFKPKIKYVEHHLTHAANSYLLSGFSDSAILTMDGMGERATIMHAYAKGDKVTKIAEVNYPHSVGHLYSLFTKFLGFMIHGGEGKVMGLASYGNPSVYKEKILRLYSVKNGNFVLNNKILAYQMAYYGFFTKKFTNLFGKPRIPETKISKRHQDIAAAVQWAIEDIGVKLAKDLYARTKTKRLCLSGGVFLNSVMNQKILECSGFKEVFIQPAANDGGCSLGAAAYLYNKLKQRPKPMKHAYLGPKYSEAQITKEIEKFGLKSVECNLKQVAGLISQGKIIAWFHGRMEFGPRALGNRSILADPRRKDMKQILNTKVKHREDFRPFAPSVVKEKCNEFFEISDSPYMLLVSKVKQPEKLPAITHIDGTARVQTVDKEINPKFWVLLKEFEKITGIPVLLNTSFNIRGQPIIENPAQAIECFLKTGIDYIILENKLVSKSSL